MPIIAIAADHAGVDLKTELIKDIKSLGYDVLDLGTHSTDSVDYPDYGHALASTIIGGKAQLGVAICGSGIGISIVANKHKTIRAALCHSGLEARLARQHNNANILCLGARIIGVERARDTLRAFLNARFEGGRHERRVSKIDI